MDWIFDNIKVLIAVAGVIAYWLSQRREKHGGDEESRRAARPMPADPRREASDTEDAVRRIQEEIRRKIMQRSGEGPGLPPPLPAPPRPPYVAEEEPEPAEPVFAPARGQAMDAMDAAETERQLALQEELKRLEERRRSTRDFAERVRSSPSAERVLLPATASESVHADLRNPDSLRRAVILREVLGAPVSMR